MKIKKPATKRTNTRTNKQNDTGDYCVAEVSYAINVKRIRRFDLSLEKAQRLVAKLERKYPDKEFEAIPIQSLMK